MDTIDNITKSLEEVKESTMNGVWKNIWPECANDFTGFPEAESAGEVHQDIMFAVALQFEVYQEDQMKSPQDGILQNNSCLEEEGSSLEEESSDPKLEFEIDETGVSSNVKNSTFQNNKKSKLLKGVIFTLSSTIFFSLNAVIVRHLQNVHPGEKAFFRFLGIHIFSLPLLIHSKQEPFVRRDVRLMVFLHGIFGSLALFLRFYAYHFLPIADVSVIELSDPIFVAIFARIFLNEPCGWFQSILIVFTIFGITLMTKLPLQFLQSEESIDVSTGVRIFGIAMALGSRIFASLVYIVIRKVKDVHHSVILFSYGWVGVIVCTVGTLVFGGFSSISCGLDQWLILGLGFLSFIVQILFTKALQSEQAILVSVLRSSGSIFFAYLLQLLLFREIPDVWSTGGAVVICTCFFLTTARKYFLSLPLDSPIRQLLRKRVPKP
ncbi:solute carrier family 35 member G1-like [Limulus polyphemus]|uniref:Solute carrier family 35 member G1-like n=1 Tax=Limulus polyphemus TaxID=6850 RepID=A0ABM1T8U4_LIMPO|nr:solute carrier family 35 member G1-like [Limulus polyphemus]